MLSLYPKHTRPESVGSGPGVCACHKLPCCLRCPSKIEKHWPVHTTIWWYRVKFKHRSKLKIESNKTQSHLKKKKTNYHNYRKMKIYRSYSSQMNIRFIHIASGSLLFFTLANTEYLYFTIPVSEKPNLPSNHSVSYANRRVWWQSHFQEQVMVGWGIRGELQNPLNPPQLLLLPRQEWITSWSQLFQFSKRNWNIEFVCIGLQLLNGRQVIKNVFDIILRCTIEAQP